MKERIHSIDIVRGVIMMIMTLDHVRDLLHVPGPSPLNMKTTTVILFFTRWITHYCAPTFVFLSGTSAFLAGQRRTKKELSRFLLTRGAWLIISDILIITFLFTFDPLYHVVVLEVLWAIGFGMIILALLIRLPISVIAATGFIIIFGHNLLDHVPISQNTTGGTLTMVFLSAFGTVFNLTSNRIIAELYAVLPWTGIMLVGYATGQLYDKNFDSEKRRKILRISGMVAIVLFIGLRLINHYGDPAPWAVQRNAAHTLLSFLNASKQPPSLLYVLMTIGPVLIFLSFAEKMKGRAAAVCEVYGNVPYFYFILHFSLIRVINIFLILAQGIPMRSTELLVWQAPGFGYPLWVVYLFWLLVVIMMYFPCKWYGYYKRTQKNWWLSYV